jgi:hypothetical protein
LNPKEQKTGVATSLNQSVFFLLAMRRVMLRDLMVSLALSTVVITVRPLAEFYVLLVN